MNNYTRTNRQNWNERVPIHARSQMYDLAGFKARIERTLAYVESVAADRYQGAETRSIAFPLMGDLSVEFTGEQFLRDFAFPNFYFHLVTAYNILRSQGVQIGKADYMAHIGYALRGTPPA